MSLKVSAREDCRELDVFVGDKRVGSIVVYLTGYCAAIAHVPITGGIEKKHLDGARSLRAAVNQIIRHLGYGSTEYVARRTLGRIRR